MDATFNLLDECFYNNITIMFVMVALLHLVARIKKAQKLVYILKPSVIIVLLVSLYLFNNDKIWLIRALIFSLFGDIFLLFSKKHIPFILGLVSFLIAHFMYIFALHENQYSHIKLFTRFMFFCILFIALLPIYYWLLTNIGKGRNLGNKIDVIRISVGIYMLVITSMIANVIAAGDSISILGSVLFAFSDTLICWHNLILLDSVQNFWLEPAIIISYNTAQFCLFWSLRT